MYIYGNDYTAIRVIDNKRKATVKALYINMHIDHLLLCQEDYHYYTLKDIIPHNLDSIRSCYINFFHVGAYADNYMLAEKGWKFVLVFVIHLLSALKKLEEVTLEFADATVDATMIELLLSCYNKESTLDEDIAHFLSVFHDTSFDHTDSQKSKTMLSHFRKLLVRTSISWCAYDAIIPILMTHREKTHKNRKEVNFDIQMDVMSEGLTKKMLRFFEKCQKHDIVPSHVSVQWKGETLKKAEDRKAVSVLLSTYNLYPYQSWHFCQPHKQSMYLRSLYATSSYFGILVGYAPHMAESWINGDATHNTIIGTMRVDAEFLKRERALLTHTKHVESNSNTYAVDWDTIDAREEFDIRMLKGEDSEIVVVPFYLQKKLAGVLNYTAILSSCGFKRFNRKDARDRAKLETANLLKFVGRHTKIGTVWFNDVRIKRRFNIAYFDFL